MRIVHVGGYPSPNVVDGINAVIWTTAIEQLRMGHQVALLLMNEPGEDALAISRATGLELHHVPASAWRYDASVGQAIIQQTPADIVHFHSVFIPRQATLARSLRRWSIPYVITPHGGLMPQVLQRDRHKKDVYGALVEKPRFRHAAGIAYITPNGEADIRRYVPRFQGPVRWVPNPVDVDALQHIAPEPAAGRPYLVFLGRYDVYHKGLDRLAEIARRVQHADFRLFGAEDPDTRNHLDIIRSHGPANFEINMPVFGRQKLEILRGATMYIQVSRWEALSISVLEALAMGIPTVISESMSMASMFREHELGLVVSTESEQAAWQIERALADQAQLQTWSERSRSYARLHFTPEAVARSVVGVYEESLDLWHARRGASSHLPQSNGDIWSETARLIQRHDAEEREATQVQFFIDRRNHGVDDDGLDAPSAGHDS
jgi:glycosyltransferase involved in cell wall biosynthesis